MDECVLAGQSSLFDLGESADDSERVNPSECLPGFRYVTVFADIGNCLPPQKNSANEAIEELITMKYIDYCDIADAWEFVSDGWCERVYNP